MGDDASCDKHAQGEKEKKAPDGKKENAESAVMEKKCETRRERREKKKETERRSAAEVG